MADKKEEVLSKEQKAWINFIERLKFYTETLVMKERNLSDDAATKMREALVSYKALHQQRLKINVKKNEKKEGK